MITRVLYVIMGSACTPLVMGGTRAGIRARGVYPRVYPPLWIVFSKKEVYFSRPLAGRRGAAARGARRARGRSPTRARLNTRRGFFSPAVDAPRAARLACSRTRVDRARRTHETPNTDHVPQDAHFRHRAARVRRDARRGRPQDHPQGTRRGAFRGDPIARRGFDFRTALQRRGVRKLLGFSVNSARE